MTKKLKVLFVSAEVSPLAKVGGLADVAGALPKALRLMGHDVRIAMPGYRMVTGGSTTEVKDLISDLVVTLGWRHVNASVKQTVINGGVPVYLICAPYFECSIDSKTVYVPGSEPYAFFAKAVVDTLRAMKWSPDVIHCNDWHTGFLPVYRDVYYGGDPILGNTAFMFTIHNLAYQGEFDASILPDYGLPDSLFTMDKLECYGKVNFLKAGMVFSDLVTTVSPTYAQEIQTPEYGCRLDGLLRYLNSLGRLRGVLNGIDYEEFNPATDERIPYNYSEQNPEGKAKNKAALQSEMGLPVEPNVPVFGLVSRLADQKGLDLIRSAASKLMKLGIQFVVLGTGDAKYEKFFMRLEERYPAQVRANIGFDVKLAQRIYAGCDMFLMPSRFEPCGLGQLISLRYGTIPIVRLTGGLADTIKCYCQDDPECNGFGFTEYTPAAFLSAVKQALRVYSNKTAWDALVRRALMSDFSWATSASKYTSLYREAVSLRKDQGNIRSAA